MVGQLVGNYRILSRLAEGGMGVIYLAEHRHMGRRAAVKVLLPEMSKRQNIIARFFDEARAASHVEHPGIVQIFDCGYDAATGQAYLVMEFLQGGTLRQHLTERRGVIDEGWAIRVALGIAEPLAAAHAKGIIHRDLKPENIFMVAGAGKETVKLLDFGVAKLTAALRSSTTSTLEGSILGTPLYMSPEQCRGVPTLDARADIYSLGCVLFEMVCGRPPFTGDNPTALIAAHLCDAPPDPHQFAPSLSDGTAALLRSMLEKDPAARPDRVTAIIDGLASGRNGQPLLAGRQIPTQMLSGAGAPATLALSDPIPAARAPVTTLSESASESLAAAAARPQRRWRMAGTLAGASVAMLIVGVVLFSARPHPAPPPAAGVVGAPGGTVAVPVDVVPSPPVSPAAVAIPAQVDPPPEPAKSDARPTPKGVTGVDAGNTGKTGMTGKTRKGVTLGRGDARGPGAVKVSGQVGRKSPETSGRLPIE